MDDTTQDTPQKSFPFDNLYLISGLVHGFNKAWMYLFTIIFLILGYVSFQMVILFPLADRLMQKGFSETAITSNPSLIFDSNALGIDRNIVFLMELLMFIFAFIGFFIGLKYVHKKTLTSVLTGYEKFRFKRFWFAFLIWGILLTVAVVLEYILNPGDLKLSLNPVGLLISILIMVVFMPVQTGLEEIVFRGYLI